MKTKFNRIGQMKIMPFVCLLWLTQFATASPSLFDSFTDEFLTSLGYSPDVIEKITNGELSPEEATQLNLMLTDKSQKVWQDLWHEEFNELLKDDQGDPVVLGAYDLDIERTNEGLGKEARHVVKQMFLIGITCERLIDTLVKSKEEQSTPAMTVGDKVIYSVVQLVREERHVEYPPLEEWTELSKSPNPIYRLIGLEAGYFAVPEALDVGNRTRLRALDPQTESILDVADLEHFSLFLDDRNQFIRRKAAEEISARVNTEEIPEGILGKIQNILGSEK